MTVFRMAKIQIFKTGFLFGFCYTCNVVLKAQNINNPILRPTGRSVGLADEALRCVQNAHYYVMIVACLRHAGFRVHTSTPHCASLREAYAGLLKYRAFGTLVETRCLQNGQFNFNVLEPNYFQRPDGIFQGVDPAHSG